MCSQADDDLNWAVHEFADADLGDVRRTTAPGGTRAVLAQHPTAALPEACGDGAMLKAAYRFFANDDIDPARLPRQPYRLDLQAPGPRSPWCWRCKIPPSRLDRPSCDHRLGAPGPYGLSRPARPQHAGVHPRARPVGTVGPARVGT